MSLSVGKLRDRTLELVKKLNHASGEIVHVLQAAITEIAEPDKQSLSKQLENLLASQPKIRGLATPTLSEPAEQAIRRLVNGDFNLEDFRQLLSDSATNSGATDTEHPSPVSAMVTEEVEPEIPKIADLPVVGVERSLEEVLAELDSLIGLDDVKQQVRSVMATHLVNKKRASMGMKEIPNSLHLVFSGEPGTGKTTVARLVSEIYRAQGILRVGHLVEVGRSDLIAEYVGQTAPKVKKAVKQALGGALFIDEAYSLAQDTQHGFGAEAIATLLLLMENHRGDLSVIVAGYKDEMDFFVASNPGLRSRFQTYIDFPRYEPTELLQIFKRMCSANEITLSPGVEAKVLNHFETNETSGVSGNARYARKLFEVAFTNLSGRAVLDGIIEDHEVSQFEVSDIPDHLVQATKTKNKLGF